MSERGPSPRETACYSGIGMGDATTLLLERLNNRTATVGVMGLGYVGLPLLVEFAKAGFTAVGFDIDGARVERIGRGESDIPDVNAEEVAAAVDAGRLVATARDDVREVLSRGYLGQLYEGAEGCDDRREGIEIRIDREDLFEAGDQEDPVVGLAHHRAAPA